MHRRGRGIVRIVGNSLEVSSAIERLKVQFGDAVLSGVGRNAAEVAVLAQEFAMLVEANSLLMEDLKLAIAPWDDDDVIDYLLAHHRPFCGSVSERVRQSDPIWRPSTSVGWRQVLSTLAFHPELSGLHSALRFIVDSQGVSKAERESQCAAASVALSSRLSTEIDIESPVPPRIGAWFGVDTAYLQCMALDYWVSQLKRRHVPVTFRTGLPSRLIPHLADEVGRQKLDLSFLLEPQRYAFGFQPISAALLARLVSEWRPAEKTWTYFKDADFTEVVWQDWKFCGTKESLACFDGADFRSADLRRADLAHCSLRAAQFIDVNLQGAKIEECDLQCAKLPRANLELAELRVNDFGDAFLQFANLKSTILETVNLMHADLAHVNFESALVKRVVFTKSCLENANLRATCFSHCAFQGCDFRLTQIDNARFHGCRMSRCNFENVTAEEVDFRNSDLQHAWLTGSVFHGADFRQANLHQAALGDIDWEGANLRGADLSQVTFHFGSTRSGLVDSPYPSHGTRTGFYTDDFFDQSFKAPEEIRVANLRGADLTNADLGKTDFYLVDLRDAKIDDDALPHLRRCKAILSEKHL